MLAARILGAVAVSTAVFAAAAWAQESCGDCRKAAGAKYQACQADAKGESKAVQACAARMSDAQNACQEGACAKDVARMYEAYCAGCMQQAGDDARKKKGCEESVCRKAAGK